MPTNSEDQASNQEGKLLLAIRAYETKQFSSICEQLSRRMMLLSQAYPTDYVVEPHTRILNKAIES
ncbi:hypothetical protein PABG_11072 [Paracoccidioides brasiliensis Pb03]|uniref:Uncharacterized protein n=1 Tax=Paracoccidioides brasiliensis (strain Pb18) TaxID=502780 RepID=C1G628_PARBD|nr:uncharacterized protein PADG_02633 [Paracoccidioides brasiliensis Pb18]EEH46535.2 hypothetical protein PADG_02633 [Paracoccidioides brasiliensis Pb18]KGY15833.1 hypothetical protein PABG_11072 [Paracoccidioides brasiliensis Pb03]